MHRVSLLEEQVQWNLGPPRQRYDEALLDCAMAETRELDVVGWLAKGCQSRRTTAGRMMSALERRPRAAHRTFLEATLRDVAEGTCSVLEHGFLTRVERPHALPVGRRQVRVTASSGVAYRDVEYVEHQLVELDGRLFHDSVALRDRDFERDLDAALAGSSTIRLSWGQVFDRPCSTAAKLTVVLARRGVVVRPRPCGEQCPVGASKVT